MPPTLAFIRIDGATCDVMLFTFTDRRERRLAACGNFEEPRVSWSADGEWLVESFAPGPDPIRGWQIARISTRTGVREALTLPTPGTLGDHSPSVSPDGTRIAFVRGINGATADLHVIPFGGGTADARHLGQPGPDRRRLERRRPLALLRDRSRRRLHHLARAGGRAARRSSSSAAPRN